MTPDLHALLLDADLDAQAHNDLQAMLGLNPSEEVDSIEEHLWHAAQLVTGTAREHVLAAWALHQQAMHANRLERECEQQIAGALEAPPSGEWSLRRVVRELRGPLGNLLNPMIAGEARQDSARRVHDVICGAPAELLGSIDRPNKSLSSELGARRYSLLVEIAAARVGA